MKKSTKAIIFSIAFCFLCAIGVFCVFAVKNFSLNGSGSIKFIAPGVAATISDATLDGLSMESGSGTMSSFSVTSTMTAAQVESLDGYKSWSGLKLLFDDEADGRATISFTVTNNSTKSNENVMVKLSSSTTTTDAIHVTPCADYCIGSGKSHTFSVSMAVANGDVSATLNSYVLTVELQLLKTEQIPTISEENTNGFTFSLDSTNKTATLTKYTKPASVSATNLSVEIPSLVRDGSTIYHVTEILGSDWSDNPFYSVKDNMVSVTLPTTLTKVGSFAFVYCSAVRGDLIIPHGVTYIDSNGFNSCNFDGKLVLPGNLSYLGSYCFYGSTFTGSLFIPGSLKTIGDAAFSNCKKFDGTLTLGYGVETISRDSFYFCEKFTGDIIIPDTVKTIGNSAFYYCTGFTGDLILGDGVTSIEFNAFCNCTGLKGKLKLSKSLTEIGECAFYKCTNLTGPLKLPKVTKIGRCAFWYCSKLSGQLVLPNTVTEIGENAFEGCESFTGELVIPSGVTSLSLAAFYACTGFTSVIIPSGVTSIGSSCFYRCTGLVSVTVNPTTPPTLSTTVFDLTTCTIYVPSASVGAYKTATNWSAYASRIESMEPVKQVNANGVITGTSEAKYTGVVYELDEQTNVATAKTNASVSATELVVLDKVECNGEIYTVDTIKSTSFSNNTKVEKITISYGITMIEPNSFAGCSKLSSIVFENQTSWYATSSADSTSGTGVDVSNASTNITSLMSVYAGYYLKCGEFTQTKVLTVELDIPYLNEIYYIPYEDGMTWQDLANNSSVNKVTNNKNSIIGQIAISSNGYVGYADSTHNFSGNQMPIPVGGTYVKSTDLIDPNITYKIFREVAEGPHFLYVSA